MYKLVVSPGSPFPEVSKFDCLFHLCAYLYYRSPVHFVVYDNHRRVVCSTRSRTIRKDMRESLFHIHGDSSLHLAFYRTPLFMDNISSFTLLK